MFQRGAYLRQYYVMHMAGNHWKKTNTMRFASDKILTVIGLAIRDPFHHFPSYNVNKAFGIDRNKTFIN